MAFTPPPVYVPPTRADPSSFWRDYMTRREPGFVDPGPRPSAIPSGSSTQAPAPVTPFVGAPAPAPGPVVVGGTTPETFPTTLPGQDIAGMNPLTWLELYRGVPRGSLGGPIDDVPPGT